MMAYANDLHIWSMQEMWQEYHKERADAMGKSIPGQQFQMLKDRAAPWYVLLHACQPGIAAGQKCRHSADASCVACSKNFLFPVYRDNGYMMILSQFQETCFLLTFLEDYRKNPGAANPWMSVTLYDDFMPDKAMGLLRGDVSAQLTKNVR